MKNFFLFVFLSFCGIASAQYVDRSFFKAGFHGSIVLGDASDLSNIGVGLDLYQHWGVSRRIDVGLTTSVLYFFGLDSTIDIGPEPITIRGEDTIYLPAAALFRFYPSRTINLGGDVGYAFGLNDFTEDGFYYRPTLSINLSDASALNFSYTAINTDNATWSTVTVGAVFLFSN